MPVIDPVAEVDWDVLSFRVDGHPAQQGSKTAAVTKAGRPYLRDANASLLRPWRKLVKLATAEQVDRSPAAYPLAGPVKVQLDFFLAQPATQRGHVIHWTTPDIDKLARAVLDSLTDAHLLGDDCQVWWLLASKRYAIGRTPPGVHVQIERTSTGVTSMSF